MDKDSISGEVPFGRVAEWRALLDFIADPVAGPALAIVSGRRRQGKSFLLRRLVDAESGALHEVTDGTPSEQLRDVGEWYARHVGLPGVVSFGDWSEAISALLDLPPSGSGGLVVLDEFSTLVDRSPAVPSIIRRAVGVRDDRVRRPPTRLVLCGSLLRVMGNLLAGSAPLRGRASLELLVQPFDYRTAAQFWGSDDYRLALDLFAVVGGTPAYRRELVSDDVPGSRREFDGWLTRRVLTPSAPLYREGRVLLGEDPSLRDVGLYHSVLAAITAGETSPSRIAGRIGRPLSGMAHPLSVLTDGGWVERHVDALHRNRTTYEVVEPLLAFHHAIIRPNGGALDAGRADEVWEREKHTFRANLVAPAFERLCRQWVRQFAGSDLLVAPAEVIERGAVPDPSARITHEVDVVARSGKRILVLGEAKVGGRLGRAGFDRLRHIGGLLEARGYDLGACRFALFSADGFDVRLHLADDEAMVDLHRLYTGS